MKNTIQDTVKEVYNTNNNKNSSFRKNVHNFDNTLSSNNAIKKNNNASSTIPQNQKMSSNDSSSNRGSFSRSVAGLSGIGAYETRVILFYYTEFRYFHLVGLYYCYFSIGTNIRTCVCL